MLDPKSTPSVSFNSAIHDYMIWVVKQPYIRKRFYAFNGGVRTLIELVVKHFDGVNIGPHTCVFKYKGITFVIEAKTAYVYSICEDY